MSNKTFKLSTLAAFILTATNSNAALYRVVEVTTTGTLAYGSAIEQSDIDKTTATDNELLGCFYHDCASDSSTISYSFAGDTRESYEGFSYKQEVPFGIDNRFHYLDEDDLESYCEVELGYSTCESWANNRWFGSGESTSDIGGLYRERQAWNLGTYQSNASAFLDSAVVSAPDSPLTPSSSTLISDSKNVVITNLDGTTPIGNTNSGYFSNGSNAMLQYRNRGFYDDILLLPKQDADEDIVEQMGRSMAFDSFEYDDGSGTSTYVVGSSSVATFKYSDEDKDYLGDLSNCVSYTEPASNKECQNFAFAMKPFVWNTDDVSVDNGVNVATGVSVSTWHGIGNSSGNDTVSSANEDDYSAQGSVRAAIVPTSGTYAGKPVLVGFNTYYYTSGSRLLMQAAVFYPNDSFSAVEEHAWDSTFITNATVRIDGEYIYSNSVAKDINDNMLVIGEAKRYNNKPEAGAFNNRLFIADASSGSPSASYFSGGIFFTGAGGEANSINNFNEIVGQIDAETNREDGGKKRRRRAFIYPYNGTGTEADRRAIFDNSAWWIDDLTNGGQYSDANNQFRIINASDINDDGVISATAIKCDGGYDSTSHNAYCGGGTTDEDIVAVKLIPIAGATSADIVEREIDSTTVSRKGAGIGMFGLTLLGLIGFRRRK